MEGPRVSVIMPSYNRAHLIGESIEVMLRQTLPPFEMIVVDDGSTDDTVAIVRRFGDRVRLIEQANAGPGAARNTGLAAASGEFVQFFDSDDVCSLDKLERQAAALIRTGADIAYGAWFPGWLDGGKVAFDGVVRQQHPLDRPLLSAFLRGWVMLIQCCLIRRDRIVALGGYPTAKRTGEDVELLFRFILSGARFEHVAGPFVILRQHQAGQISGALDLAPMRADDRLHLTQMVLRLLDESGEPVSGFDRFLWRATDWSAARDQHRLRPELAPPAKRRLYAAALRARQITAGLRKRRTGSRLPSFCGPDAITNSQRDAAEMIGYRPVER